MQQRDAVATPNSRSPVKRLVLRWGASAPQRREVLRRISGQSVVSQPPSHSRRRSTWPTLTLWSSFSSGVESRSFCLLAGIALQDDLLGTLSLSPIFLLAQILMRTDLGDEPDSPRKLRSSPTGGGHHKDAANLRSQGPYPSPQPKSPKRRQRRSQMDLSLTFAPPPLLALAPPDVLTC